MPSRWRSFTKKHPTLVRSVLLGLTFVVSVGIGLLYGSWALICRGSQCPSIEVLADYTPHQTSKLYAIDGRFIAELGLERRTLVKLDEIPKIVQDAFVVTEDKRFYEHAGIDWHRVASVVLRSPWRGYSQGFSTITMQLARNVFPEQITRERSLLGGPVRKLKEAKVARQIEAKFDKKKILELYLNQIDLGHGAYGVETASQRYFGKSVRDLNIAEAATLAALPKSPTRYNPRRFPDRAVQRRNTIIGLMQENGNISAADASRARAYPIQLANKLQSGETAPYFVEWVRQQLDAQFGKQLYEQGLKVFTTLDLDMQAAAERALERQIKSIEAGHYGGYSHETYEYYMAHHPDGEQGTGTSPYLQGAFLALDPRNGAIRAMVGGRDFFDSKFNRATQALRQPGSTFKPIVYSAAIKSGRPASYILNDSPLTVNMQGGPDWTPQNYDGRYEGLLPMRRALYMSRNIPAIRQGMELGEQTIINEARNFGITTPIPPYPSIHIGAADVYPMELIAGYTAFANLGVRASPNAIIRVENAKQEILWQPTPTRTQVMSTEEAWMMVDMMKDVVRRGTASGSVWGAGFHLPAGGKTGTTNDGTNVWFIGYTADIVAGVWMGLDKPQKIKNNAQGGVLAAPAWTSFMTEVYRRKPSPPDWPRPVTIVTREVDSRTGLLASPYCPGNAAYTEFFVAGTEPQQECSGFGVGYPGMPQVPLSDTSRPPPVINGDPGTQRPAPVINNPVPSIQRPVRPTPIPVNPVPRDSQVNSRRRPSIQIIQPVDTSPKTDSVYVRVRSPSR